MIPRGTIDVELREIVAEWLRCQGWRSPCAPRQRWTDLPLAGGTAVAGLSVRSLWRAWLLNQSWNPGDDVLMSGVNLRDMARLVEAAGYRVTSVDVDRDTLAPDPGELEAALTPNTRAVVIAHLFGGRANLAPLIEVARRRRIPLIEDAAQAFRGDGYWGDPETELSLWSFGPIKTHTALGGGVAVCRDASVAEAIARRQESWPWKSPDWFQKRLLRFAWLKILESRPVYSLFARWVRSRGGSIDAMLLKRLRNFESADWLGQLEHQPPRQLLDWLERRATSACSAWVQRRAEIARMVFDQMPERSRVGSRADRSSPWVLPIVSVHGRELCDWLNKHGYDATQHTSQVQVLDRENGMGNSHLVRTRAWMNRLVYLPLHPALTAGRAEELGRLVRACEDRFA